MTSRLPVVFAILAIVLSACGGGGSGGGGGSSIVPATPAPSGAPPTATPPNATPTPVGATPKPTNTPVGVTPTPKPTATPKPTPTPVGATPSPTPVVTATPIVTPTPAHTAPPTTAPTATPMPTPTPVQTLYPAAPQSKIRSTYGRIAANQIFDFFPSTNTQMSSSQISSDATRYDWVWGAFKPQPWRSANPQALVSRYYIIEEDNILISGHDINWWLSNHPDWILYACDSSGNPTHDYAYTPGDGFTDVPLNIHNPSVVQYQISQSLIPYAQANGYNALALDEVIFKNFMVGGNPELGQTMKSGEYACGSWNNDGTFNKVYSGPTDQTFTQDVVNWVVQAKQAASMYNIMIAVNHPVGSTTDPNEQQLMRNVDVTLVESGFTDYGSYGSPNFNSFFNSTYRYMEWVEQQGVAIGVVQKYASETTNFTASEIEYGIATYMMANEGNADMFIVGKNGVGYGYGAEQYHNEYATPLGAPCSAMYGGSSYDPSNPDVYYRRFQSGMVIANVGTANETAHLPANHTYGDIEGRFGTNPNPLSVAPHDAYVLTTSGNGCQ